MSTETKELQEKIALCSQVESYAISVAAAPDADVLGGEPDGANVSTEEAPGEKVPNEKALNHEVSLAERPVAEVSTNSERENSESVGPYEIIDRIGSGGMGIVYKVRHKGAGNILALKVLRQELASDPVNVKRFQQELKTTSGLTHPNIVPIYDNGTTVGGCPYFVMEYLDGLTLEEILREEGYLDLDRFFSIFEQVCEALMHAHEKRVIHRDLKPCNIMLSPAGSGFELAKLLDFGIARVFQQASKDGVRLTQLGEILGSPAYMSPEQCLTQKLDERSDVYSLGVVMYEALVGATPFRGDGAAQVIVGHLKDKPKGIAQLRPDFNIPPDLELLVMTCLEKDAQLRYQSIAALHHELKRISLSMRGRSVGARISTACRHMRVRAWRSARRFVETRRRWAPPLILSAILVAGTTFFFQSQIKPVSVQTYIDRADLAMLHQHYDEVKREWDAAINLAAKSNWPKDKLSELNERAGDDLISLPSYQVALNQSVAVTLLDREESPQISISSRRCNEAVAFYDQAIGLMKGNDSDHAMVRLLTKAYSVTTNEPISNDSDKYLEMLLRMAPKDRKNTQLLQELAQACKSSGRTEQAIALLKEALPDPNAMIDLANTYEEVGDTKAAIATWKQLLPQHNTEAFPHLATLYENDMDFANAMKMRKEYIYYLKNLAITQHNNGYGIQISAQFAALSVDAERLGHRDEATQYLLKAHSAKEAASLVSF